MVTYQTQLINLNNGNSDVFKHPERPRSAPGHWRRLALPRLSELSSQNPASLSLRPASLSYEEKLEIRWKKTNSFGEIIKSFLSRPSKATKLLQRMKAFLSGRLKGACLLCSPLNGIVMAIPAGWKGATTGLIRLHGAVKFSLPPPWCVWRVRDLFTLGRGKCHVAPPMGSPHIHLIGTKNDLGWLKSTRSTSQFMAHTYTWRFIS